MKNNWAITTTLACCGMFAGTIMAQQGQQVSSTLNQWANKTKTETTSTPTYTANRRIEDVTGLEKARSRGTNTDVSTTTQANDRRDPSNNNGGYNDNRRQPEYNDRNARNGSYGSRDDDSRRDDDRDRHNGCSKDNHRGGESHGYANNGYGRGSANRSNDRDRDDDRYRDRDDDRNNDRDRDGKSRHTCDSNGKNRGRGF